MTSRDFCYWLQGFFEIGDCEVAKEPGKYIAQTISAAQAACIRNHLNMVFKHEIDPSHGDAAHQAVLSQAHVGGAAGTPPKSPTEDTRLVELFTGVDPFSIMLNC